MTIQQLLQLFTSNDPNGGRLLKVTPIGGLDDVNQSLTKTDTKGGRAIKVDASSGGLSFTVSSSVTNSSAVTGNTNENLVTSFQVAENTLSAFDRCQFRARCIKTGTAGDSTVKIYINTTNSLSGATLIATSSFTSASNLYLQFVRDFEFKTASAFQIYSTTNSTAITDRVAAFVPASITYDVTQSYFFLISIQNANSGDSTLLSMYELLRK